jgi:RluA family pseudouridine synthase
MTELYRDPNYIVIDKPAGLSVHNIGEHDQDLLTLLKNKYKMTFLPIHRLDKETSGVMILATNKSWAEKLASEFQNKNTLKIYHAILRGSLPVSESEEWQIWNDKISDKSEGRKNIQGVSKDRVEALTKYLVKKSNAYLSLIEVQLLTGRQHQIRKHAALSKHAIVGDARYGDPKYNQKMAALYKTGRMMLHASHLSLSINGEIKTFKAPLPSDFIVIE